jgi:hypothetical protein
VKGTLKLLFIVTTFVIFLLSMLYLFTLKPDMPLETVIFRTKVCLLLMSISGGALIGYVVLK